MWRRRRSLPRTKHGYQPPPQAWANQWLCDDCEATEWADALQDWPSRCPECGGRLGPHPGTLTPPWKDEAVIFEAEAKVRAAPAGSEERAEAQRRLLFARQGVALSDGDYARAVEIERTLLEGTQATGFNIKRIVMWLNRSGRYEEAVGEGLAGLERVPPESADPEILSLALLTAEAALAADDHKAAIVAGTTAVRCADEIGSPPRASPDRELLERLREIVDGQRQTPREYNIEQLFAIVLSEVCRTASKERAEESWQISGADQQPTPGPKAWPIYQYVTDDPVLGGEQAHMRLLVFPDSSWSWEADGAHSGRMSIDTRRGDWFYFGVGHDEAERADALAAVAGSAIKFLEQAGATVPPRLYAIDRVARAGSCEFVLADQIDV